VFVANSAADSLAIIDTSTDRVVTGNFAVTSSTGFEPAKLVVSPDSQVLYVLGADSQFVSVLDVSNNLIGSVATGQDPVAIAFSLDGRRAYVVNGGANNVTELDTTTFPPSKVGSNLPVGIGPRGVAVGAKGKVHVANFAEGTVSVLQPGGAAALTSNLQALNNDGGRELRAFIEERKIGGFGHPATVQTTAYGNKVLVPDQATAAAAAGMLKEVNPTTDTVERSTPVEVKPEEGAVFSPASQQEQIVVPNSGSESVSLVTIGGNQTAPIVRVGLTPIAVAVNITLPLPQSCVASVTGPTDEINHNGGTGNVTVTTNGPCFWRVQSLVPWITVSEKGRAGIKTGNSQMTFTVANNSGGTRQGKLYVLDKEVTITQARRGPRRNGPSSREPGPPVGPRR
jgi:YVTN family beta-propeller protein